MGAAAGPDGSAAAPGIGSLGATPGWCSPCGVLLPSSSPSWYRVSHTRGMHQGRSLSTSSGELTVTPTTPRNTKHFTARSARCARSSRWDDRPTPFRVIQVSRGRYVTHQMRSSPFRTPQAPITLCEQVAYCAPSLRTQSPQMITHRDERRRSAAQASLTSRRQTSRAVHHTPCLSACRRELVTRTAYSRGFR